MFNTKPSQIFEGWPSIKFSVTRLKCPLRGWVIKETNQIMITIWRRFEEFSFWL